MQVTSNRCAQSSRYNQSFAGIKSVKCEGLYKKYPELGKELVETFKENPKVMDFCKKYDVDIVFFANKNDRNDVSSRVIVFYDNVAKSKLAKVFGSLRGEKDKIDISGWGNQFNLKDSLREATESLKAAIKSDPPQKRDNYSYGLVESHMRLADEKMEEALAKKALKAQEKLDEKVTKMQTKKNQDADKAQLENAIKDLMNEGK